MGVRGAGVGAGARKKDVPVTLSMSMPQFAAWSQTDSSSSESSLDAHEDLSEAWRARHQRGAGEVEKGSVV